MIKFKSAFILSIVLHGCLFALILVTPKHKSSGEIVYYVDLINMPGNGRGPGGAIKSGSANKTVDSNKITEPQNTGSVNDLVVKKADSGSKLRYPTKDKKKNDKSKIEKQRQKESVVVRRKNPANQVGDNQSTVTRKGISTGLGAGDGNGEGSGTGQGFGPGNGGIGNFPYAYYVTRMRDMISRAWYNPDSQSQVTGLKTVVYFKIFRNGEISELMVEEESGSGVFDDNAIRAVKRAAPFPRLPSDYPDDYLIVHFEFVRRKQ